MKEFYDRVFRAQPVNTESTDTWALFDCVGARFALHAIPAESAREVDISSPPAARESSPVKLVFAVDDISSEAGSAGVTGSQDAAPTVADAR